MTYSSEYPIFYVTVDIVVLTLIGDELCALVVSRGQPPHQGRWALPGGFVGPQEDIEAAAVRELREETGVTSVVLEQLRTYGTPRRDPRGRVVSVAWLAVLPDAPVPRAGTDAETAMWRPVSELAATKLAFDHNTILADGVERARSKLEYTTLATAFVGAEFTLSDLRRVYEVTWGRALDPGNFQRKVKYTEDFVVPTERTRPSAAGRGRPAAVFRAQSRAVRRLASPITRD
jgi:8-oxo-dGTP diphosphatase